MSFLKNLFGAPKTAPRPTNEFDRNPSAVAALLDVEGGPESGARASGDDRSQAEFRRFREGFCFAPGHNLMAALEAAGHHQVAHWLDPQTPEAEPKAVVRLGLALMDAGINYWEQPGLLLYLHGRWWAGGGCSDETYDCLQILAQVTGKPIRLMYQESDGADGYRKVEFQPGVS